MGYVAFSVATLHPSAVGTSQRAALGVYYILRRVPLVYVHISGAINNEEIFVPNINVPFSFYPPILLLLA